MVGLAVSRRLTIAAMSLTRDQVAVVGEVKEASPGAVFHLAHQVGEQVEAVDVHLERLVPGFVALLQFLDDVRLAGHC